MSGLSSSTSNNNSHLSSSTLRVTAAAAVVAAVTTVFSIGYMTASYYTKKKLLQEIYNSTSGCIILHDENPTASVTDQMTIPAPRRFGACIQLKPDKYIEYRTLHDNVWDHVQQRLYDSHIRNFTIYYHPETSTLYQHFEWVGHWYALLNHNNTSQQCLSVEEEQALLDADLYAITQDPVTREWWKLCEPCQQPFSQWYKQPSQQDTDDSSSNNQNESVLLFPSQGNTTGDWWAPMECVCHTGHYPIAFSSQTCDPDFMKLKP